MTADFAAFHDELRAVARTALAVNSSVEWATVAASGWTGLEIPEALDGAGATFAEVAVILHEMGRVAARSPFFGTVVLGAAALALVEPHPEVEDLRRAVATGRCTLAVATGDGDLDEPPFRVERGSAGLRLAGQAAFVVDAVEADRILLVARDGSGLVVVSLPAVAPGLSIVAQPVLDESRSFAEVTADGVVLGDTVSDTAIYRFVGAGDADGDAAARRLADRAAVAIAVDSLGVSEAMLEATVDYAKVRRQFDRPIGSFQAVKHACADMLVKLSVARELCDIAVGQVCRGDPNASRAASMAKSYTGAAAVEIVGAAMQLHGGMGYTWESGIHVHLKRATLNRALFGSPAVHRRRLAERYIADRAGWDD